MSSFFQQGPADSFINLITPYRVILDASTLCQLSCPTCPNATGEIHKHIGHGYLRFTDFKQFVDRNPRMKHIELSNWGEIFLNPELEPIIQYGFEKKIHLSAVNGANINTLSDDIIEAMVKYKLRALTCSIDGASQETYSKYRIKGHFDAVLNNIRKINACKKKYGSTTPQLIWQFVAFGHNETEIPKARQMAHNLNMKFALKLSWDDLYGKSFSPVQNKAIIRKESGLDVADRNEYEQKYGRNYLAKTCYQLWTAPRINYDGRLLGCSINYWGDYGHVFSQRLKQGLSGERIRYARQMVLGRVEARDDIPCTRCKLYRAMKEKKTWVKPSALVRHFLQGKTRHLLSYQKENPIFSHFYGLIKKSQ